MECRTLDVTIVSAKGPELEKRAGVYAVAYISTTRGNVQKVKTPVEKTGVWYCPVKFTISEHDGNTQNLVIKVKAVRMLVDKTLGKVCVPIKDLLKGVTTQGKPTNSVSNQLSPKLDLTFTYKLGEIFIKKPRHNTGSCLQPGDGVSHDGDSYDGGSCCDCDCCDFCDCFC